MEVIAHQDWNTYLEKAGHGYKYSVGVHQFVQIITGISDQNTSNLGLSLEDRNHGVTVPGQEVSRLYERVLVLWASAQHKRRHDTED